MYNNAAKYDGNSNSTGNSNGNEHNHTTTTTTNNNTNKTHILSLVHPYSCEQRRRSDHSPQSSISQSVLSRHS